MLVSAEAIVEYVGEIDFAAYKQDRKMRRAVERELEIIGEATNRILKVDSEYPLANARRIINLRNLVIHEYDVIDDAEIWAIVKRHLPLLLVEVKQHLNIPQ